MKDLNKYQYKMATEAFHQVVGEISRNIPDFCVVTKEDEDNFYGSWCTGSIFINVRFPKSTTKNLTKEEFSKIRTMVIRGVVSPPDFNEEL